MIAKDIILDETTNDLIIENGDFRIGESDQQHIQTILHAQAGQFYETPLIGVGILDHLNSGITAARIKNIITKHLTSDNYEVKNVSVADDFTIEIDAVRKG